METSEERGRDGKPASGRMFGCRENPATRHCLPEKNEARGGSCPAGAPPQWIPLIMNSSKYLKQNGRIKLAYEAPQGPPRLPSSGLRGALHINPSGGGIISSASQNFYPTCFWNECLDALCTVVIRKGRVCILFQKFLQFVGSSICACFLMSSKRENLSHFFIFQSS